MKLWGPFGSVAWADRTFRPGPDGAFDVPPEAAADLVAHGFSVTPPPPAAKDERRALARLEAEADELRAALSAATGSLGRLEGELAAEREAHEATRRDLAAARASAAERPAPRPEPDAVSPEAPPPATREPRPSRRR